MFVPASAGSNLDQTVQPEETRCQSKMTSLSSSTGTVAAGLDAFDPDEVPPATDAPPPEDITLNEDWQEERAEVRRQEDEGELRPITERHPFPPTRYEEQ
jgi:hypothetical protein